MSGNKESALEQIYEHLDLATYMNLGELSQENQNVLRTAQDVHLPQCSACHTSIQKSRDKSEKKNVHECSNDIHTYIHIHTYSSYLLNQHCEVSRYEPTQICCATVSSTGGGGGKQGRGQKSLIQSAGSSGIVSHPYHFPVFLCANSLSGG